MSKVTTQRTSKPLKLLWLLSWLLMLAGFSGCMSGAEDAVWGTFGIAIGACLWSLTKVLIWFCHE